jgi:peptidoglycan/xylan/chitin deacetylase (PgdA/CDA1 family)
MNLQEFKPPEGYEYVLFLSFDLDVDSAEYYKGSDPVARSRGRFASRRGLYKVLSVLRKYNIKSTFFIPGWVSLNYPFLIKQLIDEGHEVAAHGYLHERLDEFKDPFYEEQLFNRMIDSIRIYSGYKPYGFRAPYWRFSDNTLNLLVKKEFLYDSSLMDDEYPYILWVRDKSIAELPVDWRLDDWPYLEYYRSLTPRELLEMWIEELDYAREVHGYVSLTMHPQCIGRGSWIKVLEEILKYALKTRAWIPKGKELAEYIVKTK